MKAVRDFLIVEVWATWTGWLACQRAGWVVGGRPRGRCKGGSWWPCVPDAVGGDHEGFSQPKQAKTIEKCWCLNCNRGYTAFNSFFSVSWKETPQSAKLQDREWETFQKWSFCNALPPLYQSRRLLLMMPSSPCLLSSAMRNTTLQRTSTLRKKRAPFISPLHDDSLCLCRRLKTDEKKKQELNNNKETESFWKLKREYQKKATHSNVARPATQHFGLSPFFREDEKENCVPHIKGTFWEKISPFSWHNGTSLTGNLVLLRYL